MKKKVVIFDLDGTIFDSGKIVNDYFFQMYPTLTAESMNEALNGNFHEGLEKIRANHEHIEETEEERDLRKKTYSLEKQKAPMFQGLFELLTDLKKEGFILVVNTSALEKNCMPLLAHSHTDVLFDFVGTAEVSKNKTEKFKMIEEKYSVIPEEMIFVTDTVGDIREAALANIPTVAVTWGAHKRPHFIKDTLPNVVGIVDTTEELESLIKAN